jgi:serine/threonine protein phosphatase PrpC
MSLTDREDKPSRMMQGFSVTVPGYAHLRKGIPCQDASAAMDFGFCQVAVVADGHGGDSYPRSQYGSVFAVEEALRSLRWFATHDVAFGFDESASMKERIVQLEKHLILRWNERVEKHAGMHPFTEAELAGVGDLSDRKAYAAGRNLRRAYGSTMIAVLLMQGYWICLQLGDGNASVLRPDGGFETVFPPDEELVGSVTHSLCEHNAIDHFQHAFGRKVPAGVVLSSDGITNSFLSEDALHGFYQTVSGHASEATSRDVEDALGKYLPVLSQKGSGDDMSIAGLLPHLQCSEETGDGGTHEGQAHPDSEPGI